LFLPKEKLKIDENVFLLIAFAPSVL